MTLWFVGEEVTGHKFLTLLKPKAETPFVVCHVSNGLPAINGRRVSVARAI
jgi:hypothetical protein